MKITEILSHQLLVEVDEPFTSSRGWYYKTKGALVVEIRTDEGITGWGDCYGPAAVSEPSSIRCSSLPSSARIPST